MTREAREKFNEEKSSWSQAYGQYCRSLSYWEERENWPATICHAEKKWLTILKWLTCVRLVYQYVNHSQKNEAWPIEEKPV